MDTSLMKTWLVLIFSWNTKYGLVNCPTWKFTDDGWMLTKPSHLVLNFNSFGLGCIGIMPVDCAWNDFPGVKTFTMLGYNAAQRRPCNSLQFSLLTFSSIPVISKILSILGRLLGKSMDAKPIDTNNSKNWYFISAKVRNVCIDK